MGLAQPLGSLAPVFLRLALGTIFIAHGAQKLFGLFGGTGLTATIELFQKNMDIPPYLTVVASGTEFFGGIAVLIGLLTRLAATALGCVMVVAMFEAHVRHGFFLNWTLAPGQGHGVEFNIALLAMALSLLLTGPGRLALDQRFGLERR